MFLKACETELHGQRPQQLNHSHTVTGNGIITDSEWPLGRPAGNWQRPQIGSAALTPADTMRYPTSETQNSDTR